MRSIALFLSGLAIATWAQTWSLSGTVRDGEEGDGVKNVAISLAKAGVKTVSDKNGKWTLDIQSSGTHKTGKGARTGFNRALSLNEGRLLLELDGHDILGRSLTKVPGPAAPAVQGRTTDASSDTLIYSKDGYVTRKAPLSLAIQAPVNDSIFRIRGPEWVTASHANIKSDTSSTFVDTLRKVTFRFKKSDWDSLMKAMADSCGKFGAGPATWGGQGGGTHCSEGTYDLIEDAALIWVPVEMLADGQTWTNVAIRLKGNASLQSSWTKGSYSLPFRINTDRFEDRIPTIKNQRFHGFQKLSFFNAEQDSSCIRGPVAGEVFRMAGVPAPMSRPVRLFLDRGDGSAIGVGIYEMLEVPDNPYLKRNFGNDSGNLYKPLSKLDKFVPSEWVMDDSVDFSDAKALIEAINSSARSADSTTWHRRLESLLDVDGFLKWLAVSTAIMNWDAYGSLAHNYYLFNDRGRFRWITYDFGWSFDSSMQMQSPSSIWYDQPGTLGSMMNLGPFPLVKNLLADKSYCELYRKHMNEAIASGGPVTVESFQAMVDKYGGMVSGQPGTVRPVANLRNFLAGRIPQIKASLNSRACPIK
ncbi:MAG: hypothetical protein RL318_565 [Fibrobacterota bacterium]|jgi:hypothetical protein